MADEFYPLTQSIVRNLLDKLYEKRKLAAIDIEKQVKTFQSQGKYDEIKAIIRHCGESFCDSNNCHYRKGGTIGLAAVAIALGKQADKYTQELIMPSVKLLQDSDSRVRYYACESLYNCIKVLEGNVMPFFQPLFDALAKGYEDPDKDVRSAIIQLDRSLRDTVVDAPVLNVAAIVVFIRDKIYPKSTQIRLFIINWITSLDRTNGVNMVLYLPELLDGLLLMLDDPDIILITKLKNMLDQFLNRLIENDLDQGYRKLVNILVFQINNPTCSEIVRHTALIWLEKFIGNFHEKILPFTSGILKAILPSFDEHIKDENIRIQAKAVSSLLLKLIRSTENIDCQENDKGKGDDINMRLLKITDNANSIPNPSGATVTPASMSSDINCNLQAVQPQGLGLSETISTLCEFADNKFSQATKLAALVWLHTIMDVAPRHTLQMGEFIFPTLFKFAINPSSEVIRSCLQLVSKFAKKDVMSHLTNTDDSFLKFNEQIKLDLPSDTNPYFLRFIYDLIVFLDTNLRMLDEKGDLIIGDLCYLLGPEIVYITVSEIVQKSDELRSKFKLVHKLNRILLSSNTLINFRSELKSIRTESHCIIFCRLYKAWSYNRVALLSLCLLTQNYEHCRLLVKTFGEQELDFDTLNEIDLLIQFIESPVFAFVRMHLMDSRYASQLSETLYGLLMLLPQSDAFRILQNRLNCVPKVPFSGLIPYNHLPAPDIKLINRHINFDKLLENLSEVQKKMHEINLSNNHTIQSTHFPLAKNSNSFDKYSSL